MHVSYLSSPVYTMNMYEVSLNQIKFGSSFETFRLSYIASLNTSKWRLTQEVVSDCHRIKGRYFKEKVEFKDEALLAKLAFLEGEFCHIDSPECFHCPLNELCYSYGSNKTASKDTKEVKFVDLFAGAGGLSLGLKQAGFELIMAVDFDEASCNTLMHNHPYMDATSIICQDILDDTVDDRFRKIDLLVGGPPCQGFSNANRQRLSDDPRNSLYKEFLRLLEASSATYAIIENVVGIAKAFPSIRREFNDIGFAVEILNLNTRDFGVPQNRKRAFLIAKRQDNLWADSIFFENLRLSIERRKITRETTLIEAISDLPPLESKSISNATETESELFGFSCSNYGNCNPSEYVNNINGGLKSNVIFNHKSKYLNQRDQEIYAALAPGEDSTSKKIEKINPYKNRDGIFKDKFFKLLPKDLSKTITAHMYYDCHMYIHPYQNRGLTPREAARIQGFPDHYVFMGYPNEWYRQIGNAVSPVVSKVLGDSLLELLK